MGKVRRRAVTSSWALKLVVFVRWIQSSTSWAFWLSAFVSMRSKAASAWTVSDLLREPPIRRTAPGDLTAAGSGVGLRD